MTPREFQLIGDVHLERSGRMTPDELEDLRNFIHEED